MSSISFTLVKFLLKIRFYLKSFPNILFSLYKTAKIYRRDEYSDKLIRVLDNNAIGALAYYGHLYINYIKNNYDSLNRDVVFISKIADLGPVHWLPDKLIKYRLHHDNDSNYSDIHSKLKLLNYYKSKIENDLDVYGFFRYRIWVRWLFSVDSSSCKLFSCKKKRIVWIYIIKRSLLYLLSNPVFLYRVIKKIK